MAKQQTSVIVPRSTALATPADMPAYLTASLDGREQISQDDLSLPRLMVANALSAKVVDGTLRVGSLYDSTSGNVLHEPAGTPLRGVFLATRRQRTKFRPKGQGDGIECHSPDAHKASAPGGICRGEATDNCGICEYAQFGKNEDGSIRKPACTEYRELLYYIEGYPIPLVVSFGKSTSKAGKKLVEKLNADMGTTGRPLYAFAYELDTALMSGKAGSWWVLRHKAAGYPSEALYTAAKKLYDQYKESLRKLTAAGLQGDEEAAPVDTGGPSI